MSLENIACNRSFGGWHKRYRHHSATLGCDMVFSVYLPPQAELAKPLPVLYWLSGLTCTDENFMQKAGAQRMAAEQGIIIVASDTSPRGEGGLTAFSAALNRFAADPSEFYHLPRDRVVEIGARISL